MDVHTGPETHVGPAAGPGGAARAPLKHLQQAAPGVRVSDQAVRTWPRGAQRRAVLEEPDRLCRDKDAEAGERFTSKKRAVTFAQWCKGVFCCAGGVLPLL